MIPTGIVVHHTAGNESSPETLRAVFKARFGVDYIGYHYAIFPDGSVAKDISDETIGIHNNGGRLNNTNSVGISLVGNFEEGEPTQAQLDKLVDIARKIILKYTVSRENIVGHRDMKATACPGRNLYSKLPELINKIYTPGGGMFTNPENHIVAVKTEGSANVAVLRFVTGDEYKALGEPPVQTVNRFNNLDDKGNVNPVTLHQSIDDYYFENQQLKESLGELEKTAKELEKATESIVAENQKIAGQYQNVLAINVTINNINSNLTLENGALKERVEYLKGLVDDDLTWLDYLKLAINKLLSK